MKIENFWSIRKKIFLSGVNMAGSGENPGTGKDLQWYLLPLLMQKSKENKIIPRYTKYTFSFDLPCVSVQKHQSIH